MEHKKIAAIINNHIFRYPKMQIEDLYKLCHHACMGSEHAITNKSGVRDWLTRELEEMGPGPDDPLIDEIASDGRIIRVHLRPFVRAGGDPETLLDAFLKTANEFEKDETLMRSYGGVVHKMYEAGELPRSLSVFNQFFTQKLKEGFPAVHHSPIYEVAYRPAYRVVARALFSHILSDQK